MAPTIDVYLARHGQTAYNLERRFQGHLPVPLDDTGRAQAAELAERAGAHTTSPRCGAARCCGRAKRPTSWPSASGWSRARTPRLMETDAGDWTDRLFVDVQAEDPDGFAGFVEGRPELRLSRRRVVRPAGRACGRRLADVERGELPALVVCHGVVIRIALFQRAGHRVALAERVPNAALVPLDPVGRPGTPGSGERLPPS